MQEWNGSSINASEMPRKSRLLHTLCCAIQALGSAIPGMALIIQDDCWSVSHGLTIRKMGTLLFYKDFHIFHPTQETKNVFLSSGLLNLRDSVNQRKTIGIG